MNEYPFHGGDGYTMLKNKNGTITNILDIDNVIAYIERKGPIYISRESRIIFEGQEEENDVPIEEHNKAGMTVVIGSTTLLITLVNLGFSTTIISF